MKKIFTLVAAAFMAMGLNAQVNSTRTELSPMYLDAENSDKTTWKFIDTDITITNGANKGAGTVDRFGDPTGATTDTCELSFLKVSKDVLFKLNMPDGQAAVRIEFWGVSNSSAGNLAYLCYLANPALDAPIVSVPGGQNVDGITGRDIMDNEAIKALSYVYGIAPKTAESTPVAVIEDKLGWYSELSFLFDGNNQVGTSIVVYTVPDADLANYDPAKDQSIKTALDGPITSTRVELSPLYLDTENSDKTTWKFTDTDITITNGSNKGAGTVDRFGDPTGTTTDTCELSFLKVSKDVLFKLNIPEGQAAVRIEFWGVSNSSAGNLAYLCHLTNPALDAPIVSVPGGVTTDGITGRDITDNDTIREKIPYFYDIVPQKAETTPVAVFQDKLGWFGELEFLFDGNNQVGTTIVVYTVPENDLAKYDPYKDKAFKAELDRPAVDPEAGITTVEADTKTLDPDAPMYNILGQPVSKDYKGIVIQKGNKFILR